MRDLGCSSHDGHCCARLGQARTRNAGPGSHTQQFAIQRPGSHIARGKLPFSKNVRRGTGVPHRISKLFGNEIAITVLLCVCSHMIDACLENPRRGTGVPHRTRQASTFQKCATRDRGPTLHVEVVWQRNLHHSVIMRTFSYDRRLSRKSATRDRGPTSHAASFHFREMCDAGPGSHIACRRSLATKSRSHCYYAYVLI